MTLTEQVYTQTLVMARNMEEEELAVAEALCRAAVSSLSARLRVGLTPEDCKADFVAAASLYALAALSEADELMRVEQIQIGDMTLKRGGSTAAAACLRYQAELMMAPYLKDRFCFRSV
jgi:hypothetical protein